MKSDPSELLTTLKIAEESVRSLYPNGYAKHTKSGIIVRIKGLAFEEASLIVVVIYTHGDIVWTRPLQEFVGKFEKTTED